jgi:D-arabinose 1-dehydrogenase-like Zn-dependent alcohol dehydrogenase
MKYSLYSEKLYRHPAWAMIAAFGVYFCMYGYRKPYTAVDAQQIVRKIIQIRGLHNYNFEDLLNATSFVEKNYNKHFFQSLIEKEFQLEDVEDAFHFAVEQRPVRVGIKIND